MLLGLHGYGDEISNFKNICLTSIADTANYICVYAEGLPFFGANAWNSGAGVGLINVNSTIDDVGFLNGLVDTVIKKYSIDTNRMYVFGFSFGGFMTDRLATQNSSRFAAVANVSGLR
ncbi:MAG: prolyl oligopeptidase family serine peptidase [Saprospirales bacterium]|nr:prolyl oligopeptidase family serine peptidase [Saprospirales bacterium]